MKWSKVALSEVCSVDWGNTSLTKSSYDAKGQFLAVSATGGDGRIGHWEHKALTPVVSAIGAQCGKLFLPKEDFTAIKNTITLTPIGGVEKPEKCCPLFLYHLLSAMTLPRRGASQPFISKGDLEEFLIPLPPLEEQRRIATILDKADRLASLQARASIIGKEWVGSVFSEYFTDSESYIEISIEEALESQILLLHKDGNHGSSYPRAEDFGVDGVPFISAKSIDDSGAILDFLVARLSEEKAQSLRIGWLEPGDVLLAHNASVGKTALYEGQYQRALIGTSLTAFRPNPNHLNSHYLLHYLSMPSFQGSLAADMSQTTRNQVPITAQRRLALRIPPLSKQEEFAARVMSVDRLSGRRRQSFRCVDALRESLFGALLSP